MFAQESLAAGFRCREQEVEQSLRTKGRLVHGLGVLAEHRGVPCRLHLLKCLLFVTPSPVYAAWATRPQQSSAERPDLEQWRRPPKRHRRSSPSPPLTALSPPPDSALLHPLLRNVRRHASRVEWATLKQSQAHLMHPRDRRTPAAAVGRPRALGFRHVSAPCPATRRLQRCAAESATTLLRGAFGRLSVLGCANRSAGTFA